MNELFYIIIIIILLYLLFIKNNKEGLSSKLSLDNKKKLANDIINNIELFTNGENLYKIKNKFSWVDAIIYEDVRKLKHDNKINLENIINIL